jgi:hypothetical protein
MRLPVYVVITKLDMVSGFKEYSRSIGGELRRQIVGFDNQCGSFNEDEFAEFWRALLGRLRSGAKKLLDADAAGIGFASSAASGNRMDGAGKIWLFPETFNDVYANLSAYLRVLFGEHNFHGSGDMPLAGVYFTSATDINLAMSPQIAALAGASTDDFLIPAIQPAASPPQYDTANYFNAAPQTRSLAVLPHNPPVPSRKPLRGFFIRDLFNQRVFIRQPEAVFTRARTMIRHIPHYIGCAAMIALGVIWLSAALFKADELRMSLVQITSYYDWLGSVLEKGAPFKSPLIKGDGDGHTLDNAPIEGESFSSRVQFYYNALAYRDMRISPPFGFRLSSLFVFREINMGYRDRAFIANQLHATMVRLPAIIETGEKLSALQDIQTLDNELKAVIASFVQLDDVANFDFHKLFASGSFHLDPLLRYLLPGASDDTLFLLNSYLPKYDRAFSFNMDMNYIYSEEFARSTRAAYNTILSAWRRNAVYPDSTYGKLKEIIGVSEDIAADYKSLTDMLKNTQNIRTFADVKNAVFAWKNMTEQYKSLTSRGRALFDEAQDTLRIARIPLGIPSKKGSPPDAFGDNLINGFLLNEFIFQYAVKEYNALFERDMDFVNGRISDMENKGALAALRSEFPGILNADSSDLKKRSAVLQADVLFSQRMEDKPDAASFFMVTEKILSLASALDVRDEPAYQNAAFEATWNEGRSAVNTALGDFDAYTKPYLENEKTAVMIPQAASMRACACEPSISSRYKR